ncbi:MAG: hypothetical protein DWI00_12670 [Planctomycetota bacterium]|nr:MAG: hypothetical protein DWI00_12670 [Planctomycetota bacterium]
MFLQKPLKPQLRFMKGSSDMTDEHKSRPRQASLLVEHSHGVCEIIMQPITDTHPMGSAVMILKPLSGSGHTIPSHSAIANALQMQRWMIEHPLVFSEGLTAN